MHALELTNLETADLCRELALLLHSGVSAGDSLYLMAEEEKESRLHGLLTEMAAGLDRGNYLHQAFQQAGCFPVYITGLLRMGEAVGRTEETLTALAAYYENREKLRRQIVSSLTYPTILLLLMLVVIIVLLSKVLPVFNEIYMSLGGQLGDFCCWAGFWTGPCPCSVSFWRWSWPSLPCCTCTGASGAG